MIAILTGLADEAKIITGGCPLSRAVGSRCETLVLCGSAQRDALARLVPTGCAGLVSFGVCGGLVPQVAFGDILIADSVRTRAGDFPADAAWSARLLRALATAKPARFYSDPGEAAETAAARKSLAAQSGAWVVDQETGAVAALAAARGIPWAALRSPSDIWDQSVSAAAGGATEPDGSPAIGNVVGAILRDPNELGGFLQDADGYAHALTALRAAYQLVGPGFAFPT